MTKYIGENNYEHGSVERTGILLTNLGTPDEPNSKAVKIYLAEFLSDTRVIEFPKFIWKIILHGIILRIRPKRSAKTYKTIWTDEGSPLLNIAKKQIELVKEKFEGKYPNTVFALGMRYGNPSIESALLELQSKKVRRLIIFPLYPH